MAVDKDFVAYVRELLAPLGPVAVKPMFGGAGVYLDGLMFALLAYGTLYFRVDDQTEDQFRDAGSEPFIYAGIKGREVSLGYWRAPDDALEGPDEAEPWARLGLEAAMRKRAAKGGSKRRGR